MPQGSADPRDLTDAVTQLRRVLRSGIRSDISWEQLPMAQVEILQSLAEDSPARVSDLAERLRLAQSTVSGLIGQMMTSGLVTRETDASDRRAAVVRLSDAGRQQLDVWEGAHLRWIESALSRLGVSDQAAIGAALPGLRRLTEALSERGAENS